MNGLFYVISAAWLLYGIYAAVNEWRMKHRGLRLEASVKGHETDGARYYPLLGYHLEGRYVESRSIVGVAAGRRMAQGEKCEIWVLPRNPAKVLIVGQSNRPAYLFSILIGLCCCAASIWMTLR